MAIKCNMINMINISFSFSHRKSDFSHHQLQLNCQVGTPADWHFGEDVMPATNVAEDAFVDKAKEKPVPSGRRFFTARRAWFIKARSARFLHWLSR